MSDSHSDHPFHLLNPSPWPLTASIGAFIMALGAVQWFHDRGQKGWMLAGLAIVAVTAFLWWRDVVREARRDHAHTPAVRHGLRLGMALFIASEVMFFAGFFWAFFNGALGVNPSVSQWPPAGIEPLHTWSLPFINTLILLSSGATLTWAHHGVSKGHQRQSVLGLAVTVALGILFLSLQMVEYGEATFKFTEGVYPSVFYMATGFHGFHVLVGVCFLIVCTLRAQTGHFTPGQHVGFEAAAWYWHFVDVVWLFLFVWVYWWGNS
ncbi:Cytochrome c oxidase subunit III [Magnetospirillum gryphiswaldense MSR-1 v2]|uniref:cytochrome-c oxidase n=1 Tax=Magnetospirillum gryphiswaldense (strain DSM 6361 / JCM 21280 / NBRC 15271 / MSR-1) TaxID=431944 RepID=V6EXC3_MAGGM|nr:cytochrome c oxidase subunit 3 [Magnetospirillum gryphiswaldense]CDK97762.1 Cytochrome c oxidase subunit III [Magnetospirillum gryphiswaldense MSR-1 v2]